ncbi:MAG: hypothetical protein AAB776_00925 [Patescibacteria group bacterium]
METQTQNRIIGALIAVALIVAAVFWIKDFNKPEPAPTPEESTNWQTYTNNDFGFSLQYPDDFNSSTGDSSDYPVGSMLVNEDEQQGSVPVIATVVLNESDYANTNLAGAWITAAVLEDTTEADCKTMVDGRGVVELTSTDTQDGITWYEHADGWSSGAADGTKFDTRVFHTFKDDRCYEVSLHLATSNIGNYEPGAVTAVDEGALRAQLQGLAHTFQFTE